METSNDHFEAWLGRSEERRDTLVAAQAERMAALLDREAAPGEGDPLPPLWHWTYFAPTARQSEIGPDGHPKRGGFMPPIALPRRMWAGGRLNFHAPLHVGESVSRTTEILSIKEKTGSQGKLVFLTLKHSLSNDAGLALEEEQDIVYRQPSTTALPPPATETPAADWREGFSADPVVLFRYSALTFNAHRIHYDLPYATGEEGYPGLVVHGPLTATLLLDAFMRRTGRQPKSFSFRGQAPLFAGRAMAICGKAGEASGTFELWAEGPGGYRAMAASVTTGD